MYPLEIFIFFFLIIKVDPKKKFLYFHLKIPFFLKYKKHIYNK